MIKFWIELKLLTVDICLACFLITNRIFYSFIWNVFPIKWYILMMLNVTTKKKNHYFSMTSETSDVGFKKKKKVLNDCFQKQCSRHYDNFVILVNKNAKKRKNFICNFLFDWCLESIYLQKITVWEMSCFFSIELLLWLRWRMKYYLCFLL